MATAGSPIDVNDLVFHTLRSLPKEFKCFKTNSRTRSDRIGFNELVAMFNGEDQQLSKDLPLNQTTVLVATHEKQASQGIGNSSIGNVISTSSLQSSMSQWGVTSQKTRTNGNSNQFVSMSSQSLPSQSQFSPQLFVPQQQFYQN